MRLVFLGTPAFACPSLRAVVEAGHDVPLVVSQPDKVRGRRGRPVPTPVRQLAGELGLATMTLLRNRRDEMYRSVLELEPDVVVIVAFGHIVREPLLHGAPLGCVNLHASLLPRWRGPAPIHRAILAGDAVTGVCTMRLEAGVDTGPLYLVRETSIGPDETAGELHDRLARIGAQALVATLAGLRAGTLSPRPQPEQGVTHAPMLTKDEGTLDFGGSGAQAHDRIRGLTPWPGVTVRHGSRRLKLLRSRPGSDAGWSEAPGTVVALEADAMRVSCAQGTVDILRVQPAGRKDMDVSEYARGYGLAVGDRLLALSPDRS